MSIRDYTLGVTFDVKFTTRRFSTGAPFTLAGTPVVSAYPDNSLTQLTAGITLTVDFDGVTGLNNVRVVATSGNGYADATSYALVITTGTVDSVSVVGEVVGEFTLGRPSTANVTQWLGTAAATPTVAGVPEVDLTHVAGTVATAAGGRPEVNVSHFGGTAGTFASGRPETNVSHISGDSVAADNAEAFFDGTGYAGTGNVIPSVTTVTGNVNGSVGSVTGAVGSVTGAVGSVTGLTASNLDATVSSRATPAQVNTEVLDVINVDTFAEESAVPAATSTLKAKLNWLFALARNKRTTTATTETLRNDADGANIATSTISDDATTFTRGEWA